MKNLKKDLVYLYLLFTISYLIFQILVLNSMILSRINWYYYLSLNSLIFLPYILFVFLKINKTGELIILNIFNFLLFWTWLEIGGFFYFKYYNNDIKSQPSHLTWYDNPHFTPFDSGSLGYMGDVNPYFGRWRLDNSSDTLKRCGDNKTILLESNEIGARDSSRNYTRKGNVAVLGDSFMEGYLVNSKDRLSNLLENYSKVPHLNFTVNQANPVQYWLIYKNLVKPKVNHETVLLGIFPANDFISFKNKNDYNFFNFPSYRPFSENNLSKSKIVVKYTLPTINYSVESFSFHKDSTHMKKSRAYLKSHFNFFEKVILELNVNSYFLRALGGFVNKLAAENHYKNYISNFSKRLTGSVETQEFENGLIGLVEETGNKKVIILLIPDIHDINYFNKKGGKDNFLANEIKRILPQNEVVVIDLLPYFARIKQPYKSFIACDGHWNELGNRQAFDFLIKNESYQSTIKTIKQELR